MWVDEQRHDVCPDCGSPRRELIVVPGRFYCAACGTATPGPAAPRIGEQLGLLGNAAAR